jgi:membrane protein
LAFFPVLLLLLSGLGLFFQGTESGQHAEDRILNTIEEQASPALREQVQTVFSRVRQNAKIGGPIGLATLLVATIFIFTQFDAAFDRIWRSPHKSRGVWHTIRYFLFIRLKAFLMLAALGAIVVAVFLSGMILSAISEVAGNAGPLGEWGSWAAHLAVSFTLNFVVFTCIYKLVPRVTVPWRAAAAGGLLAAGVWEIGRLALAALVIGRQYSAYGVVGAFLAIMLWAYYAVSVIFIGAEFAQTLALDAAKSKEGG